MIREKHTIPTPPRPPKVLAAQRRLNFTTVQPWGGFGAATAPSVRTGTRVVGALGGIAGVGVAAASRASRPRRQGREAWAGASGRRAAEPGPRAPGWQVPAPQPRPAALSAASWPAPRGPNALRVRLPLPGWCAPRSCVTPDSCPGLRAGAGALMAASGNQVSWPKLSPFVSLCVCGSGGLTAAAPLLGGFRCGNRWRRAPRRVTWWRGPRTGPRSDPDPPRPILDPPLSFGSAQPGLGESLRSAVPGRWVGLRPRKAEPQGRGWGTKAGGGGRRGGELLLTAIPEPSPRPASSSRGGPACRRGEPGRAGQGQGPPHCVNRPSPALAGPPEPRCSTPGPGVGRLWVCQRGPSTPELFVIVILMRSPVGQDVCCAQSGREGSGSSRRQSEDAGRGGGTADEDRWHRG